MFVARYCLLLPSKVNALLILSVFTCKFHWFQHSPDAHSIILSGQLYSNAVLLGDREHNTNLPTRLDDRYSRFYSRFREISRKPWKNRDKYTLDFLPSLFPVFDTFYNVFIKFYFCFNSNYNYPSLM